MILCNLKNLLTEKGTNISRVARDTGISRTTLTSLYNNACQGVQLDTVNTLCKYLNIGIENLFLFSKYDIRIRMPDFRYFPGDELPNELEGSCYFTIDTGKRKKEYEMYCVQHLYFEHYEIYHIDVELSFFDEAIDRSGEKLDQDIVEENRMMKRVFSELSPAYKQWIREKIEMNIEGMYYPSKCLAEECDIVVNYPQELK